MAERVERIREVRRDDEDVVAGGYALGFVERLVWFVFGVITLLLAFRFLLALFGANPSNSFANFIYDTSHPFVAPFFGLFNYNIETVGPSRFELYTLIAILVYLAVAYVITSLLRIPRR